MTPDTWEAVSRELNTVCQLARAWLPEDKAAKVCRHIRETRRMLLGATAPEGPASAARRFKLWRADPRCLWCGRVTNYFAEVGPKVAALDHLQPKGQREGRHVPRTVLACLKCNRARGRPPDVRALWVCPAVVAVAARA